MYAMLFDLQAHCLEMDSRLAWIDSQEENNFILRFLTPYCGRMNGNTRTHTHTHTHTHTRARA
jgi:hypothetical protein